MWPVPDWGWGMGFQMVLWWVLVAIGLLAVVALLANGFRHGPHGPSRDEREEH